MSGLRGGVLVAGLLLAGTAFAQSDVASNFAQAEKGDPASQLKLAQALEAADLPVLAASYDAQVLQSPNASALDAVRQLLELQEKLGDEYLIPSLLASRYQEGWAKLPPEQFSRLGYLLASVELRKGQFEKARAHLSAIPKSAPVYARAQYLLGVVLSDAAATGGAQLDDALKAFQAASAADGGLHDLAQLAIARTLYALHRYDASVQAYEAIPRGSRYWPDALFENGFARFRAGDPGGALGTLQALHAPQFAGAFQPESWILKATIYYFNCLYDESATAMRSFQDIYGPMEQALRPLATGELPLESYYRLVATADAGPPNAAARAQLPPAVANWVRKDERMLSVFHLLDELNRESSSVAQRYQGAVRDAFDQAIAQNRQTVEKVAGQLAKNRVVEAYKSLKRFDDQSEVLRFESTKGEKELIEAGLDRKKILDGQRLYRPPMPGSDWEYWRFEGEFWSDEIGSYRYTLKNGCPSQAGAK